MKQPDRELEKNAKKLLDADLLERRDNIQYRLAMVRAEALNQAEEKRNSKPSILFKASLGGLGSALVIGLITIIFMPPGSSPDMKMADTTAISQPAIPLSQPSVLTAKDAQAKVLSDTLEYMDLFLFIEQEGLEDNEYETEDDFLEIFG